MYVQCMKLTHITNCKHASRYKPMHVDGIYGLRTDTSLEHRYIQARTIGIANGPRVLKLICIHVLTMSLLTWREWRLFSCTPTWDASRDHIWKPRQDKPRREPSPIEPRQECYCSFVNPLTRIRWTYAKYIWWQEIFVCHPVEARFCHKINIDTTVFMIWRKRLKSPEKYFLKGYE